MKCDRAERRLLAAENPDQPGKEVELHLAGCRACRTFQRRLLRMEAQARQLPVPASRGKAILLARLHSLPPVRDGAGVALQKERGLQKLSLAAAMAAALVLFALGLWYWPHPTSTRRPGGDPLLAHLVQRDLKLASARDGRERVETLSDLADDLHEGARTVAAVAEPEDVGVLVGLYEQTVTEGLVVHVAALPADERDGVAKRVVRQLTRARDQAAETAERQPRVGGEFRRLAAAASRGAERLGTPPRAAVRAGFPVALALVTTLAHADNPLADSAAEQRARHLHRNRSLIVTLVRQGLRLAAEPDPLRRADHWQDVIHQFADAMQSAVETEEGERVAELGQHLQTVLKRGVAENLVVACANPPAGSTFDRELRQRGDQTLQKIRPLENLLGDADAVRDGEVRRGLEAVAAGRADVEAVLRKRAEVAGAGDPTITAP